MELLNPFWVTGFRDGEGCFSIQFVENKKYKLGLEVRPSFYIGQSKNKKGLREILDISYQMNLSENQESRRKQKQKFYIKLLEKKSFQKSPTV